MKQYYVKNKLNHEARWQEAESELDACIKLGWDSRDCEAQQKSPEEIGALVDKEERAGQKPANKWLMRLSRISQLLAGVVVIVQARAIYAPETDLAEVKGLATTALGVAYIAFVELFCIRRRG